MNLSMADLRNYCTEFHETWWSYRYMFLVGTPTPFEPLKIWLWPPLPQSWKLSDQLETYIYNSTKFHEILCSSSWDLPWTSSWSAWAVLNTTLCDKVCQWLSTGTSVSSIDKADRYEITEILLKVALNTMNQTLSINGTNLNTQLYRLRVILAALM
jgi:hypothetical protein